MLLSIALTTIISAPYIFKAVLQRRDAKIIATGMAICTIAAIAPFLGLGGICGIIYKSVIIGYKEATRSVDLIIEKLPKVK